MFHSLILTEEENQNSKKERMEMGRGQMLQKYVLFPKVDKIIN